MTTHLDGSVLTIRNGQPVLTSTLEDGEVVESQFEDHEPVSVHGALWNTRNPEPEPEENYFISITVWGVLDDYDVVYNDPSVDPDVVGLTVVAFFFGLDDHVWSSQQSPGSGPLIADYTDYGFTFETLAPLVGVATMSSGDIFTTDGVTYTRIATSGVDVTFLPAIPAPVWELVPDPASGSFEDDGDPLGRWYVPSVGDPDDLSMGDSCTIERHDGIYAPPGAGQGHSMKLTASALAGGYGSFYATTPSPESVGGIPSMIPWDVALHGSGAATCRVWAWTFDPTIYTAMSVYFTWFDAVGDPVSECQVTDTDLLDLNNGSLQLLEGSVGGGISLTAVALRLRVVVNGATPEGSNVYFDEFAVAVAL